MTKEDRAYYRTRYAYAAQKAAETEDASARAAHLVMAAEYRQRAAMDEADTVAAA